MTIDILPPVRETDGPALVPGAAHVRVSLPLKDNSELMWGSDLTPLYEPTGARLMCFTAFLPLGIRLVEVQRLWLQGEAVVSASEMQPGRQSYLFRSAQTNHSLQEHMSGPWMCQE